MSEVEDAQRLFQQVQAACAPLESNENAQLADEAIQKLILPVMSFRFSIRGSADARQVAHEAYSAIWDYTWRRYPDRHIIMGGCVNVRSSKRFALHFTAILSNSSIWDDILTVREFINHRATSDPMDPETFDSLVQKANAIMLAPESEVDLYLALQLVKALNNHGRDTMSLRLICTNDLSRLKEKIRSKLDQRIYKQGRKKWPAAFRQRLFEIQSTACAGCGAKFNSHSTMALDHIKSRNMGGANTPGNLQLLCHLCNGTKNDSDMWFLKESLRIKDRMVNREAAERAHNAALSFTG